MPLTETEYDEIAEIIHRYIVKVVSPMSVKMQELENRTAEQGPQGEKGEPGQDGQSIGMNDILPALESMNAKWQLEFERRAQDILQKAIDKMPIPVNGKDGRDGSDGKDGLGFDDLMVGYDGLRTITIKFKKGDAQKDYPITMPVVIDQGVYDDRRAYQKGDAVTYQGSYWISQQDNPPGVPGTGSKGGWRLAVKKGRDGKDITR